MIGERLYRVHSGERERDKKMVSWLQGKCFWGSGGEAKRRGMGEIRKEMGREIGV